MLTFEGTAEMGRTDRISARILYEEAEQERRRREAIDAALRLGPPAGSRITAPNWKNWWKYGFVCCPSEKRELTCRDTACKVGSRCANMRARGLYGDGQPLPRQELPACGAKTRARGECRMRVVPGKRRCRLHGGSSTGVRTEEGKERIRQAQLRRWAKPRE